jgi:C4-dicarboxylate-specific signal transduction histidine kinase
MQRWGISESRLPPESTIYYRDPTAWERYRWQITMIAGALLVQTFLIVGLLYEHHRRRNAEAASRQHLSELAHVNRRSTAGELSASIAHEMLQPLAAIVAGGNAGLRWLAKAKPNLDRARASFEGVIAAAQHASNVVHTIRSMFKKSDDEKFALDLNRLIQEVLEILRVNLRQRGVSLETRLSTGLPEIIGNHVQLQQVILNLLANAVDAMDSRTDGDRMLKITANRQEPSRVLITIEDSGPGVGAENIERIFEPFYTTKPQGMGMGLTMCRSIVEAHGGCLVATPGRLGGLAMQISLPASANGRTLSVDADAAE